MFVSSFWEKKYLNVEFEYVDEDCPFVKRRVDSAGIGTGYNAFYALSNHLNWSR